MAQDYWASPIGTLELTADHRGLTGCRLVESRGEIQENQVTKLAKQQLMAYFAKELEAFTVPLCPEGTAFQMAVWANLGQVAFGESVTYGQLAETLKRPTGARAVGNAVGRNPLLIFIPCHRVLPKAGGVGGFSAGVAAKAKLVALEGISTNERWCGQR